MIMYQQQLVFGMQEDLKDAKEQEIHSVTVYIFTRSLYLLPNKYTLESIVSKRRETVTLLVNISL